MCGHCYVGHRCTGSAQREREDVCVCVCVRGMNKWNRMWNCSCTAYTMNPLLCVPSFSIGVHRSQISTCLSLFIYLRIHSFIFAHLHCILFSMEWMNLALILRLPISIRYSYIQPIQSHFALTELLSIFQCLLLLWAFFSLFYNIYK